MTSVVISVDPIRTLRGKRWVIRLYHENSKQLLVSGNRYANREDALTVAHNIADCKYHYTVQVTG